MAREPYAPTPPRVIAIVNGKGGVGKTSIAANLAGLYAAAGYRVCAIDLDPQGNLGIDLGYKGAGLSDNGAGLLNACVTGTAPVPISSVRDNLDVVAGGRELHVLEAFLQTNKASSHSSRDSDRGPEKMARAITTLASGYDLTFLDCPPGSAVIQEGALRSSRFVLIPTKTDDASRDGLREVAERFREARQTNPLLDLVGVVLFGLKPGATRIRKTAVTRLATDLGSDDLVLEASIRQVEAAAVDARRRGQLAHELELALESVPKWYDRLRNPDMTGPRVAASAVSLAEDYAEVARELLARIEAAELQPEVPA